MKLISGGVTAAKGFRAAGVHAGVKAGSSADKNDLAMILCDTEASAAGIWKTALPGALLPTPAMPTPVLLLGMKTP